MEISRRRRNVLGFFASRRADVSVGVQTVLLSISALVSQTPKKSTADAAPETNIIYELYQLFHARKKGV